MEGLECWNVGADQAPPPFFCSASAEFGLAGSHRVANCPFMMPYERLEAWQACHQLFLETYRVTQSFPKAELYGLTSQMRRAAFSAAANIAEGTAKRGPRELRRFLDTALGSLSEMSYAILAVRDLALVSDNDWKRLDELRRKAGKLTWGLYRHVRRASE